MIVPISIRTRDGQQRFFPRELRGKDLPDAVVDRLYRRIVPEWFKDEPPPRRTPAITKKRSS